MTLGTSVVGEPFKTLEAFLNWRLVWIQIRYSSRDPLLEDVLLVYPHLTLTRSSTHSRYFFVAAHERKLAREVLNGGMASLKSLRKYSKRSETSGSGFLSEDQARSSYQMMLGYKLSLMQNYLYILF